MKGRVTGHRVIVLGAGGHARVVLDVLAACGVEVVGLLDAAPEHADTSLDGIPVLGGDDLLDTPQRPAATGFIVGVGGSPGSPTRAGLFEKATRAGYAPLPAIAHPASAVAKATEINAGSIVMAGAVVQPGARIGENTVLNTRAVIEHDCVVGDHAHAAPGAVLLGGATLGRGAHLGAGAVVLEGRAIGDGAVVGAGAVVLEDVPAGSTVVGVPARPVGLRA